MVRNVSQTRNVDKAIGITAIVIGVLVLIGKLTFGWLIPLLGAVLLILGILGLLGIVQTSRFAAVAFVVIGILLLVNVLNIPGFIADVLDIVVGVALIVIGILRLS